MKIKFIILYLFFMGCMNDPLNYYGYQDFDVLPIGTKITDIMITPDNSTLIATDKTNNSILVIDIEKDMKIRERVWVGSEPTSLDMNSNGTLAYVGLNGGSMIAVVDILSDTLVRYLEVDENHPYDIALVDDQRILVSFLNIDGSSRLTKLYEINSDTDDLELVSSVTAAGPITFFENNVFIMDNFYGHFRLYKYLITNSGLSFSGYSSPIIPTDESGFWDIESIPGIGVALGIKGNDFEGNSIDHALLFDVEDVDLLSSLDVGSDPIALSSMPDGSRIFVAPMDADDFGVFIIEFNSESYLESNYYLLNGNVSPGALEVDRLGEYFYVAVDNLSDNSNFEPYSSNSFDLQRVKIEPMNTYPINQ